MPDLILGTLGAKETDFTCYINWAIERHKQKQPKIKLDLATAYNNLELLAKAFTAYPNSNGAKIKLTDIFDLSIKINDADIVSKNKELNVDVLTIIDSVYKRLGLNADEKIKTLILHSPLILLHEKSGELIQKIEQLINHIKLLNSV